MGLREKGNYYGICLQFRNHYPYQKENRNLSSIEFNTTELEIQLGLSNGRTQNREGERARKKSGKIILLYWFSEYSVLGDWIS